MFILMSFQSSHLFRLNTLSNAVNNTAKIVSPCLAHFSITFFLHRSKVFPEYLWCTPWRTKASKTASASTQQFGRGKTELLERHYSSAVTQKLHSPQYVKVTSIFLVVTIDNLKQLFIQWRTCRPGHFRFGRWVKKKEIRFAFCFHIINSSKWLTVQSYCDGPCTHT